jgi:hypothetical protein
LEIEYAYKEKVNSLLKKFTLKTTLIVLLSPILFFVIYHLLINRSVPKDDENPFRANHKILEGNWYFTDKDSSAVYFLDVKFRVTYKGDRYFNLRSNHSLTDYFQPFSTNKMSGEYNFTAKKWDSLMIANSNISLEPKKYNEPLVLPIKNEDLEIDFKDGRLIVSLLKHNINSRSAYKELKSPETQNLIYLVNASIQNKRYAEQIAKNEFEFEGIILDEEMGEWGTNVTINVTDGIMKGQQLFLVFHDGNYWEEGENYFNNINCSGEYNIGDDKNIGRKVKGVFIESNCLEGGEESLGPTGFDEETGEEIYEEPGESYVTSCYRPIQLNYK